MKFLIAGAIKPTDPIFRIEKDIADEYFDKKKEFNDDDDKGRMDNVED